MMGFKCASCEIELKEGRVYKDGYSGAMFCSWDCAVNYMSEFFYLEKGKPNVLLKDGDCFYDDELQD